MHRPGRRALEGSRHETAQEQSAPAPAPAPGISNHALAAMLARDATKEKPKQKAPVTGHRVELPSIGAVPIESMQWSPTRGHDQPSEITFTSKVGDHSADLMREALQGKAQDVEVFYGPLKLKLKGAIVSNYQVSSGGEKDALESWTLNFQGIEFEREGDKKEDEDRGPGWDLYPG